MRIIALFNGFFRNFIDSSDDVECDIDHILEHIRDEKSETADPLPVDDNAEVRQQFLQDMERINEDPIDAFLRRSRERRALQEREERESSSFNPPYTIMHAPPSWGRVERTSPTFPGYPYHRSNSDQEQSDRIMRVHQMMTTEEFRRFYGIGTPDSDDAIPTPSSVISDMASGFQSVSNSLNSSMNLKLPDLSTSGNQDYIQLESQLQDFARLVQRLLHAESPADFSIQKALVEESLLTILPEQEKSSGAPYESSTCRKLDLELD